MKTRPRARALGQMRASVSLSAPAAFASGEEIAYLAKAYDPLGLFRTDMRRFYCPIAGIYRVGAALASNANLPANGYVGQQLLHRGSFVRNLELLWMPGSPGDPRPSASTTIPCAAGDWLSIGLLHNQAGAWTLAAAPYTHADFALESIL